ncbi:hypothetical protein FS842_007833 [Serendipita sp. 407]|nr:hypothetical protein FS842_007833 [Serendipita sp. 407]
MKKIRTRKQGLWHEEMIQRYGHVIKYKAYFGVDRVYTTDTKAVNYVLNHSMVYRKPDQTRFMLSRILGDGLLFVEGHDHKRQRRVMNPSFGTSHIRDMTSIFVDKSAELRDVLMSRLTSKEGEGEIKLDVLSYLSRATLDIIGLAGFDYSFNTLANEEDGLAKSFKKLFQPGGGFPIAQLLKAQFPILRSLLRFDQQSKYADDVHRRMTEIGKRLIETKKEEVKQQRSEGSLLQGTKAKDLLSLLIFSNLDDMTDASKALTDDEVLHQIPTFLLAGHETTSTATAWTLLSLADNPEVQKRLRDEILNINTESPTMEELNSLPYLETVVRESLRYHAVVSGVIRVATEDDIIPLDKPFVDTMGKVQNSIMSVFSAEPPVLHPDIPTL